MATISFSIPDDKIDRIKDAMAGLYPIPIDDNGQPLFTKTQWAKEAVRRWLVHCDARWRQKAAQQAISYSEDDTIVS